MRSSKVIKCNLSFWSLNFVLLKSLIFKSKENYEGGVSVWELFVGFYDWHVVEWQLDFHYRDFSTSSTIKYVNSKVTVTRTKVGYQVFFNALLISPAPHTVRKLYFLFKIWTPRIRLNTFVPNSNIFQIRLKSEFKTSFYDPRSKFWNVMLQTFHWEMYLKFSP